MNSNQPKVSEVPQLLYKYRYFDEDDHHISIIDKYILWFTSAENFNDPFDSVLEFDFSDEPPGIMDKWAYGFVKRKFPQRSPPERKRMVKEKLIEIKSSDDYADWFHKYNVARTYNTFGICSLTSKFDNLLMWAHYSDNHTGYCVGLDKNIIIALQNHLDKEHKLLLDMVKIDYQEKMPMINFFTSMLSDQIRDDIITLLSTKSIHWQYEEEYRLTLFEHVNHALLFPKQLIKTLYLGCRIKEHNQKRILSILDRNEMETEVFQATPNGKIFELLFNRIR